jgi:hypothetical protein
MHIFSKVTKKDKCFFFINVGKQRIKYQLLQNWDSILHIYGSAIFYHFIWCKLSTAAKLSLESSAHVFLKIRSFP